MHMNEAEKRAVLGVVGMHRVSAFEADTKTVRLAPLGVSATLIGERRSAACREIADATGGVLRRLVDAELPDGVRGTQYEPYERYLAADRILSAIGAAVPE